MVLIDENEMIEIRHELLDSGYWLEFSDEVMEELDQIECYLIKFENGYISEVLLDDLIFSLNKLRGASLVADLIEMIELTDVLEDLARAFVKIKFEDIRGKYIPLFIDSCDEIRYFLQEFEHEFMRLDRGLINELNAEVHSLGAKRVSLDQDNIDKLLDDLF